MTRSTFSCAMGELLLLSYGGCNQRGGKRRGDEEGAVSSVDLMSLPTRADYVQLERKDGRKRGRRASEIFLRNLAHAREG